LVSQNLREFRIKGPGCCSEFAVAFHYMDPAWLYSMEYLVYRLRPYGLDVPFNAETGGAGDKFSKLIDQTIWENAQKKAVNMTGILITEELLKNILKVRTTLTGEVENQQSAHKT